MRRTALCLSFLFAVFVFLLPQFLSTSIGKPFFIRILEKKLQVSIEIEALSLSWLGPQVFQAVRYAAEESKGTINEIRSEVPLWFLSKMKGSFLLKNGNFSFNNAKIEQVNATFKNNILAATGKTAQGGYFSIEGQFFSKKNFNITADISALPVIAIDSFLKTKSLFKDILGDTLNLKGKAALHQTEGVLDASISSTQLTTSIQAKITEKALYLKEPLKAIFRLTDPLNSHFLKKIKTKNPIIFSLDDKGFSWDRPFSIKTLVIHNGSLDVGQIEYQSSPSLNSLLSLFRKKNSSGQVSLWLAPLLFRLNKEIIEIERIDALLAGSIHICCWGSIDIAKNSLHLSLGIPSDTLRSLFGIKNVHPNYVLKIPVRGSIQNPEIETGPAVSKIAAMAASGQIPKAKKFLNPLIHIFSSVQEEGDAPPPKRPFPWEK